MSEILGVLFAAMVGLIVIPQYAKYVAESNENVRMVTTAQQHKLVYEAAARYLEQNANALQSLATATTPTVVTVAMLQSPAVRLLDPAFSATNPYQQTWQVQVLQPQPGYLQALVLSVNGQALSDRQAAKIGTLVGAAGGFVPQNDSGAYAGGATRAVGAYGGWQLSTTSYTVAGGHPAALLTVAAGQVQNNHLYRNAIPGQPQLNEMNTALGMTGNDINGVGVLTGRRAAFSRDGAGDCCAPESATLSVSEDTQNTGRKPGIQFHAGGRSEGSIELSGDLGEPRRINLRDHQGAGLGLDATGRISAPSVAVPGGPNLKVGNSTVYGDGANTALRQSGSVWIEHDDLSPAALNAGDIASRKGTVTTASNWWSMIARDEGGSDNASQKSAAGSLSVNDVFIRSIGKWASELAQSNEGTYLSSREVVQSTGYIYNDTGRTLTIQAHGGINPARGNPCHLDGSVDTAGTVSYSADNNPDYAKSCAITFQVPPNASWKVDSTPWPAFGNGHFVVAVYRN